MLLRSAEPNLEAARRGRGRSRRVRGEQLPPGRCRRLLISPWTRPKINVYNQDQPRVRKPAWSAFYRLLQRVCSEEPPAPEHHSCWWCWWWCCEVSTSQEPAGQSSAPLSSSLRSFSLRKTWRTFILLHHLTVEGGRTSQMSQMSQTSQTSQMSLMFQMF